LRRDDVPAPDPIGKVVGPASRLRISEPLAMVVCGLIIGNQGRTLPMSDTTRR